MRSSRLAIFWLLDRIIMVRPHGESDTALIIRLDGIGDFVLWLQSGAADTIVALRQQHARVVLVANPAWASLAVDLGVFDEIVVIDPLRLMRWPLYRVRMLWRIRSLDARTTIQPRSARVFLQEDEIAKVAGSELRIGAAATTINISARLAAYATTYYSKIIPVDHATGRHESAKNIDFVNGFCGYTGAVFGAGLLAAGPQVRAPRDYVVLAPGAGWNGKKWPVEKFAQLVLLLHEIVDTPFLIVGSAVDSATARAIQELAGSVQVDDWTGRLTLRETVNLIAGARLVVSNDTGAMHISVWCGTPVVGLMGGGHPGWFAPYPVNFPNGQLLRLADKPMPCYGCSWNCIFNIGPDDPVPCVGEISVETALAEATAALH